MNIYFYVPEDVDMDYIQSVITKVLIAKKLDMLDVTLINSRSIWDRAYIYCRPCYYIDLSDAMKIYLKQAQPDPLHMEFKILKEIIDYFSVKMKLVTALRQNCCKSGNSKMMTSRAAAEIPFQYILEKSLSPENLPMINSVSLSKMIKNQLKDHALTNLEIGSYCSMDEDDCMRSWIDMSFVGMHRAPNTGMRVAKYITAMDEVYLDGCYAWLDDAVHAEVNLLNQPDVLIAANEDAEKYFITLTPFTRVKYDNGTLIHNKVKRFLDYVVRNALTYDFSGDQGVIMVELPNTNINEVANLFAV